MCGCAVELNIYSFIRARQKDTPNTDEARAHTHTLSLSLSHTHTHTHTWFLFHLLPPLPCQRHSQRLFRGNIFHPKGNVCAPTFIVSCKVAGIERLNPTKPFYSPPLLRYCFTTATGWAPVAQSSAVIFSSWENLMWLDTEKGYANKWIKWLSYRQGFFKSVYPLLVLEKSLWHAAITITILFCFSYLFQKLNETVNNGFSKWFWNKSNFCFY